MLSTDQPLGFDSIDDAIESFKNGEFIVVLDSPSRENEGDLIIAASAMTPEKMAFMIRHTSGIICTPILPSLCESLELLQMVEEAMSEDPNKTAYTISIDANDPAITTGISAHDRSLTCTLLASSTSPSPSTSTPLALPSSPPTQFRRPGHIFPLRARPGLTRVRRGHTEAALEFCRLAQLPPVGVISELVDDGDELPGCAVRNSPGMLRGDSCLSFARSWNLRVVCIEDLVAWVEAREGKLPLLMCNGACAG